jgi:hypothetical protein
MAEVTLQIGDIVKLGKHKYEVVDIDSIIYPPSNYILVKIRGEKIGKEYQTISDELDKRR